MYNWDNSYYYLNSKCICKHKKRGVYEIVEVLLQTCKICNCIYLLP